MLYYRHKILVASAIYDNIIDLFVNSTMETKYDALLIWLPGCTKDSLDYSTNSIFILLCILSFILASIIIFSNVAMIQNILHQVYSSALRTNIKTMPRLVSSIAIFRWRSHILYCYEVLVVRCLFSSTLHCKLFHSLNRNFAAQVAFQLALQAVLQFALHVVS